MNGVSVTELLTIFSRVSNHRVGFWAAAVIVDGLNPDLIGHVRGRSRHYKLGNVSHIPCGPVPVHIHLAPLDSVFQTRPIRLKTCQRLCGEKRDDGDILACFAVTSLYLKMQQNSLSFSLNTA